MTELAGKHIVLGLSGGIACYKAAELCRALVKEGASVQVVMTEAAQQFITPVTMQSLSGRAVYHSQWDARAANNMAHINLSREADAILVAPASADQRSRGSVRRPSTSATMTRVVPSLARSWTVMPESLAAALTSGATTVSNSVRA